VSRCINCHGAKEQKGDLRLDSKASLFADRAADKDARPVVSGKPDESELVRRTSLPPGDDDIMPAKGEPLSKEQQELLRRWVAEGASWPANGDEWIAKELAAMVLPKITFELPAVDAKAQAAIDASVAELKKRGAVVQQVAADTPAIDVNLSLLRDKITDADLALLAPLAPRLVWLNVSRTAISDAAAKDLASLTQLRRLHAANTKLGDATFGGLGALAQLEYVNAYGTALTDSGLAELAALPKLTRLYVWQSKVTADGAKAARAKAPKLQLDLGDYVEERMTAAQKEIDERNARNKPINETCPVLDKPVDPAQTIEFEGRRIGFCCAKCKAAFQKEPAKYASKLPPKTDAPADKPADKPTDKPADKPINEKCPVSGEPIDAAHTIEFEGRRIGFCCGKCKAAFEKEPAKYAASLPPKTDAAKDEKKEDKKEKGNEAKK
jgi:YHS domain-containing protein